MSDPRDLDGCDDLRDVGRLVTTEDATAGRRRLYRGRPDPLDVYLRAVDLFLATVGYVTPAMLGAALGVSRVTADKWLRLLCHDPKVPAGAPRVYRTRWNVRRAANGSIVFRKGYA